jgi:flagellum-specific peptidoglycan hydrolase FlgJ
MNQKLLNIIFIVAISSLGVWQFSNYFSDKNYIKQLQLLKLEQPEFLLHKTPEEGLKQALLYYKVHHPEIVYAQAILETGNFKSNVLKNYNNLFGLYDSKNKTYYKFKHWTDSVIAYLSCIQRRYRSPTDYYYFLNKIKYAEDPYYTFKLKQIVADYNLYTKIYGN